MAAVGGPSQQEHCDRLRSRPSPRVGGTPCVPGGSMPRLLAGVRLGHHPPSGSVLASTHPTRPTGSRQASESGLAAVLVTVAVAVVVAAARRRCTSKGR